MNGRRESHAAATAISYGGHPADGWTRSPLGLLVPPPPRRRYDRPVAVDLFAGAGGFGLGMHQAGFHVAAACEVWVSAAVTYMVNLARPGVRIHFDTPEREAEYEAVLAKSMRLDAKAKRRQVEGQLSRPAVAGSGWISHRPAHERGCEHFFAYDIRNLTGELVLDALGLEVGDVTVVTGGPPCQGFSKAGKRDVMDPRNSLVFEFARLITEIRPKTFVMENVPGLLSMVTPEGMPVIDAFCLAVAEGGYGEYEALRKALGATDGARAGVRGAKTVRRRKTPPPPAEPAHVEQALFDLPEG